MNTIWKYPVKPSVSMPGGATVLTVRYQAGVLMAWCSVDTDAPMVEREFYVYGTGEPDAPASHLEQYVASVQDGPYVWHVYVRG